MKEYTKKQLDRIIRESMYDVDEMARRQKGIQSYKTDKKTGERIYSQTTPLWADDNPTKPGEDGTPDAWLVNPDRIEGGEILVVPLDCEDMMEFVERKKDFLEKLKVLYKLEPLITQCGINPVLPKFQHPVNKVFGIDPKTENTLTFQKWATTKIYPIFRQVFGNQKVQKRLEELSLPPIEPTDRSHIDNYAEIGQSKFNYSTHTFNSYGSQQEFLEAVEARIFGEDSVPENLRTYYLARQYNEKYRNWLEDKGNESKWLGKTEKYKLDAFGYKEGNLDVTVRADLNIKGEVNGNNFVWVISYITKFGKKLKDERRIKNGLELDNELQVIKQVPIGDLLSRLVDPSQEKEKLPKDNPEKKFYTLFNVPEVIDGLRSGLVELREKFFTELDPVQVLDKANIRAYDVSESNIKNSKYEKLLREIKIKKPLRK